MALPIAIAPRNLDAPGEKAYRYARAGVARSGSTRSQYVAPLLTIDWIVRDANGTVLATTELSDWILIDSLAVTQAINEEPDTCSFSLRPRLWPSGAPSVGQEIRVNWAPGVPVFHGFIVTSQSDWRLVNRQPPWIAIQCQDAMWRFDARIVTYRFPAQSVTDSIRFLVQYFCNVHHTTPHALDFTTAAVQPGMPSIPAFEVVNQRPSTVMRTLMAAVGGGFYVDGRAVHAWAGSLSEPQQSNPTPLTHDLKTLHTFRLQTDATQLRRAVLVEGRRTATLAPLPEIDARTFPIGIPLGDATLFDPAFGVDYDHLVRMGSQWARLQTPVRVRAQGQNPPQTTLKTAFTPGQSSLKCMPLAVVPPVQGWIRIGNQYAAYQSLVNDTGAGVLELILASSIHPYGQLTVPMVIGETVEWIDCVMEDYPHALQWIDRTVTSPIVRSVYTDTPVVVLAVAQADLAGWPPLEGFVQDGRYSYTGAQARADADLATFQDPLLAVEWETDDLNAVPGRTQVIALSSPVITPAIVETVTILRVELRFPLRTRPARRTCSGGMVKPSTFLDLVVTEQN